ncbi:hypothetical protein [Methylicorpusculum sp.]|uniref:hypothetical protein n=1 Tax=Methylicorpusculum sp. TaxID=2713644 RepID=UPI00272FFF19|nr:hypothetical protein [Methylicorpusculum sp.]MDP3530110.1 hypothetical protein [Methylicorpusculum sp.]
MPPQSGCVAPIKVRDAYLSQLKEWIDGESRACRVLVSRLTRECEVSISASTLRNELKRMGYVWKRTLYSLKTVRSRALRAGPARNQQS